MYAVKKTWSAAKDFCVSLGGNLASVDSETENQFLHETMTAHVNVGSKLAGNTSFHGKKLKLIDRQMSK